MHVVLLGPLIAHFSYCSLKSIQYFSKTPLFSFLIEISPVTPVKFSKKFVGAFLLSNNFHTEVTIHIYINSVFFFIY